MKSRRSPAEPENEGAPLRSLDGRPGFIAGGEPGPSPQPVELVSAWEKLRLDIPDERLIRLAGGYFERAPVEVPERHRSRGSKRDSSACADCLTIRLKMVEDERQPLPDGCVEEWSGAPPRFTVRLGQQLETISDADGAFIDGWVSKSLLDESPRTVGRLLIEAPLAAVRAGRGWQVVHAATVVGPGGAVVIRGASDAGKSTLAAAAWKAGLEILGDESLLVRRQQHEVIVATVREVLVRPSTAEMLELKGEATTIPGTEPKLRLALPPIPASARSVVHRATVLLGAKDRPGGARLGPLEPGEFAARFAGGEIPQERWHGSPEALVRDWARRPAFLLEGAVDLGGAVALIERLCRGESV